MNTDRLKVLVVKSGLTKQVIAEKCNITRPTLDNLLNGSDAKISTVENLASFFAVPVGYFFEIGDVNQSFSGDSNIAVGRDNNGKILLAACEDQLDDALLTIKHLEERLKDKEEIIEVLKMQLKKE